MYTHDLLLFHKCVYSLARIHVSKFHVFYRKCQISNNRSFFLSSLCRRHHHYHHRCYRLCHNTANIIIVVVVVCRHLVAAAHCTPEEFFSTFIRVTFRFLSAAHSLRPLLEFDDQPFGLCQHSFYRNICSFSSSFHCYVFISKHPEELHNSHASSATDFPRIYILLYYYCY